MPESRDYYRGAEFGLALSVEINLSRKALQETLSGVREKRAALPAPIEATPGPELELVEKLRLILDKIDNASCTVGEDFGDFGINVLAKQGLDAIQAARQKRGK